MEHLDYPAEQVVRRPPAEAGIKSTQPPAYPFKEVADCLGLVQHPVAAFRVDYPLVVLVCPVSACSRAAGCQYPHTP